jgi:hypothetical protein
MSIRKLFRTSFLPGSVFLFITIFAQVIIPIFNNDRDIFFLSTWHLFATPRSDHVLDVICKSHDGKLIHLLRDYYHESFSVGLRADHIKQYFSNQQSIPNDTEREYFKKKLQSVCASEIRLVKIQLSYFEHYALKKVGNTVEQVDF